MKLYRHYKNQDYKYLGLARHSETEEEVVIYETRYECKGGRTWVRPKSMFFETVEIDGREIPRFRQVPLDLRAYTEMGDTEMNAIAPIAAELFGSFNPDKVAKRLEGRRVYLLLAFIDDRPVGFKLGYESDAAEFHSWLGGVREAYRGLGIASELMQAQHVWCRQSGYKKITTSTHNQHREMLLLNLKKGFDVVGTEPSSRGLKILMEKDLLL